jgi:glycine/D-amino acid oxidase-like deaminating enzyme
LPSTSNSATLWTAGDTLALPSLSGQARADVCVIGLGGSGLVCLNELRRLGVSAVGIDAGVIGGGAAGRNGGFLLAGLALFHHEAVVRYGHARARALYQLSLAEMDRIEEETPEQLTRPGSLRIAESDEEREDCRRQLDAMRRDGLPAEWYEGEEGTGLLIPGDGSFQPFERCRALAQAALAGDAPLYGNSRALSIESAGDAALVRTGQGEVRCGHVVVAVDGALDLLLPELQGRVRTARLQMLATAPTREVTLTRPVYARWGYDYWQQRPDGAIAMGGGRDIAGESEWTHDSTPTATVQAFLERRLRETLGVHAPITHRWAASVSYTDDRLPIVEEVRRNVWAIGGYSGTGNTIGALLGRGLARWLGARDDALLQPFLTSP